MQSVMRTRVVKIGNSQGIRIPKVIVEQFNLNDEIELLSNDGMLVIRPAYHPRAGWDDLFKAMSANGDDALLDAEVPSLSTWDEDEWAW